MAMKHTLALSAIALLLSACGGAASDAPKGEISKTRTAAFKTMMPEFADMGKMVKGDEAFDEAKFQKLAAVFAENAQEPFKHFQNDPQGNGDALPAVWEKPAEFEAAQNRFLQAVDTLNSTAQTAKLNDLKAAHGEVGASCKACHDSFRRPK
ncbi:MAG: cytochrome c [Neisseria sp.]|nr:cytochrome c [Neisseria sp.]